MTRINRQRVRAPEWSNLSQRQWGRLRETLDRMTTAGVVDHMRKGGYPIHNALWRYFGHAHPNHWVAMTKAVGLTDAEGNITMSNASTSKGADDGRPEA